MSHNIVSFSLYPIVAANKKVLYKYRSKEIKGCAHLSYTKKRSQLRVNCLARRNKKEVSKKILSTRCQDPSTWSLRIASINHCFQHSSSMRNKTKSIREVFYLRRWKGIVDDPSDKVKPNVDMFRASVILVFLCKCDCRLVV